VVWFRTGPPSRSPAPRSAPIPDEPRHQVSARAIYTWIEQDRHREHWKSFLRRRGRRPCRRKNPTPCAVARIRNRPEVIERRLRWGDFEGDAVLGPAGTGGIVTLVCRRSRFTIITKIQSKDADHVHGRIQQRLKDLAEDQRRSTTFDNGTEFARRQRLEKHLGLQLYFADPGCPHQRGTNENTNGLIRQYFPKGTDFHAVSHRGKSRRIPIKQSTSRLPRIGNTRRRLSPRNLPRKLRLSFQTVPSAPPKLSSTIWTSCVRAPLAGLRLMNQA
jgi:IS30 family transposase